MPTDRVLVKKININAPAAKVWNAVTNPEIIKQWLFGTNVTSDWKVGSTILFTGTYQGQEYRDKGNILQFEKEKIFQYDYWSGFSGLPDSKENYSIICFELSSASGGTQLTLTHSHFPTELGYEHSDKNWDATLNLMKGIIEK